MDAPDVPADLPTFADDPTSHYQPLPADVPAAESASLEGGWRREITKGGRRWQWRKGYGSKRQSRPGGPTTTLDAERLFQYAINKQLHHQRRAEARRQASVTADIQR